MKHLYFYLFIISVFSCCKKIHNTHPRGLDFQPKKNVTTTTQTLPAVITTLTLINNTPNCAAIFINETKSLLEIPNNSKHDIEIQPGKYTYTKLYAYQPNCSFLSGMGQNLSFEITLGQTVSISL